MDQAAREAEFTEYAVARAERLRKTAYLICGDWHRAQDLTQIAGTTRHAVTGQARA